MKNKKQLIALAVLSLLMGPVAEAAQKPNVVIIYGDDVGFGDIGVNGSEMIPTPNIDKLAAGGLNFTDAHSPSASCSPSRFSMLTGILATRRGVNILGATAPLPIKEDDFTLPKLFKQAGYETAVIGKWHLGLGDKKGSVDWNGEVKPGPLEIGFDYSFLIPNTNDRVPCVYLENHRVVNLDPSDPLFIVKKGDPRSTEYPDGRKNPEAMTYYKYSHGHDNTVINGVSRIGFQYGGKSALWSDETMSDEFVKRTKTWLDGHLAKDKDKPFFLYYASQCIHVPRMPNPRFVGKSQLGLRGDSMVELDWVVGELMRMLEERGLSENTMVIFSSDNGPVYDDGYMDGSVTLKSSEEKEKGHDGSGIYRGGKYQIYEGGTRVPMIVSWPGRIKPGTTNALVSHTDFIASFSKLLGEKLPEGAAPDSQYAMDALLGEDRKGNRYQIEEIAGDMALRDNDWKLISFRGKARYAHYDLSGDVSEQNNVLEQHPERAEAMKKHLLEVKKGAGVRELLGEGKGK